MKRIASDAPACAPLVDACLREAIDFHVAPPELRPLFPHAAIAGSALAVKHVGSVDVFLEAFYDAPRKAILVIDNQSRDDEGCIGDLTAIEAQHAGIQGAIIDGRHRDSSELERLRFPVLSRGSCPAGPNRKSVGRGTIGRAKIGMSTIKTGDHVSMDADGAVFVAKKDASRAIQAAREIMIRERRQATDVAKGVSLREQFRFDEYRKQRAADPQYTFREHVRRLRAAIEV